jgi:hypothetical protein
MIPKWCSTHAIAITGQQCGPLVVYNEDSGIVKVFHHLPGVERSTPVTLTSFSSRLVATSIGRASQALDMYCNVVKVSNSRTPCVGQGEGA